ncbi:uncharacterized protein LOC129909168 [Episyrphus balteatus]|uniref:uncharacterized protein LOC129909168 n=1 Tax=Episyrphus balteatus TaxID=286459 RepID=UPI002485B09C|nr:uncharacterized protein LOC129909168 [Episyrphus balteatus]
MSGTKPLFDDRIKPKNVLALNEKVAAIRCYEVEPVYKKIGRMFNCSPDQIKRIVKQKDEIMEEWENRTKKSVAPTSLEIKTVRMSFLGKAVHEWIRRIMYYTDFNLNDTLIQTMALEFSKVLKLEKFYPTKDWIAHFRATYKLPDANTKTMSIGYQESHSVQILDILRHVKQACETTTVHDEDSNSSGASVTSPNPDPISDVGVAVGEIKTESDDEFYDDVKIEEEDCQPSCSTAILRPEVPEVHENTSSLASEPEIAMPMETEISEPEEIKLEVMDSQPEPEPEPEAAPEPEPVPEAEPEPEAESELEKVAVYTHKGAISCVKLLEDFALLKENFRLIGLIERLEEALNGVAEK